MLRIRPEDCIIANTLFYAHIATIKSSTSWYNNKLTVVTVRMSETADRDIIDPNLRIEFLY